MQWDSHHSILSKYCVVGTLHHRAKTICSSPQLLQQEDDHLSRVLTKCKYPVWAINRVKIMMRTPAQKKSTTNNANNQNYQRPYIVVPYYQGLSESIKGTCNKFGVQVLLKGGVTMKNLLMAPKDQDPMLKKSGIIYGYKMWQVGLWWGVNRRVFQNIWRKVQEHQKAPSPIYDHYNTTGHKISIDNFSKVGREDQNLMRTIKEAVYIRVNNPSLNRNVGKYHLPHIWGEVLFNTSELKIT